jgi:hypothetical protein
MGQVTVDVTQEQQQFLAGETLTAAVRITNLSGQDLQLGAEDDWLTFALESREGVVVPKLGEAPVAGTFVLPSSKVAIKRVDLAPYFLLSHPGTYQIVATVHIRGWSRELTSPPKSFDLIQGVKIWEREVGVPKAPGSTSTEPEIRRYTLQQANYLRGQIRLYLRVTDFYGKPIRVFALGPMVSFGRPEQQVDRFSNLHVLCQDGASSFSYTECNLDGEVTARRTYDYADSRPRLRADEDGNVVVVGGTRRIAANDVPPPPLDDTSEVAPPPTNAPAVGQINVTKPSP